MHPQPWLASYGAIPAHIDPDAHPSIVHLLDAAIRVHAHRPAFTCLGQTLTYAEVDRQARAFAAYLQCVLGARKGDRVAVMCPNLPAFPIALLGIARAGCVQVNVNPLYTPRELEHQLNDAGVRILVIYAGATPTLAAIQGRVALQSILTVAPGDGCTQAHLPSPPVDAGLQRSTPFAQALAEGAALPFVPPLLAGGDLLFLQYTGGTTGLSKNVFMAFSGPRKHLAGMGCKARRAVDSSAINKRRNAADRPARHLPEGLGRNRTIGRPGCLHGHEPMRRTRSFHSSRLRPNATLKKP